MFPLSVWVSSGPEHTTHTHTPPVLQSPRFESCLRGSTSAGFRELEHRHSPIFIFRNVLQTTSPAAKGAECEEIALLCHDVEGLRQAASATRQGHAVMANTCAAGQGTPWQSGCPLAGGPRSQFTHRPLPAFPPREESPHLPYQPHLPQRSNGQVDTIEGRKTRAAGKC